MLVWLGKLRHTFRKKSKVGRMISKSMDFFISDRNQESIDILGFDPLGKCLVGSTFSLTEFWYTLPFLLPRSNPGNIVWKLSRVRLPRGKVSTLLLRLQHVGTVVIADFEDITDLIPPSFQHPLM